MSRFAEIADYVGFDDADRAALAALMPLAEPGFRDIVERFYERIQSDPVAASVLRDEAQVGRLKLTLMGWLRRLLSGPWDDDYFERRSRIGRVHVQVELPQRFMLLSMSVIRTELHAVVERAYADEPERRAAAHRALNRILDLDLTIMLGTYRADTMAALRRLEEVERRLIAEELQVSEERSRALLDSVEIIAIAVAADGALTLFNRQAEVTAGYSRTEMLDRADLERVFHPSDLEQVRASLDEVASGHPARIAELRMVSRAGDVHYVRWHIAQLPTVGDGSDVCMVGVDLTAERELAERTRRVESLATLGTLAAGLAHEIRNPLNAAQLQLTVAERRITRGDGRAAESISVVRDELGRLATLVGDFLAYARPGPLRMHPCDIAETAKALIELLRSDAAAAGVTLELDADDAVAADCDEQRIQQILINLVRNAMEAAGAGGRVVVGVERRGPSAVISVVDSGPGFPDDIDVFEPFATSKDTGTGLGLSIVKRIVEDHDGRIHLGRRGDETLFEIEIPIARP